MAQIQALQSRDLYLSACNIPSEAPATIQPQSFTLVLWFNKIIIIIIINQSWFHLNVENELLSKSQGGLWDRKAPGPFPPCF